MTEGPAMTSLVVLASESKSAVPLLAPALPGLFVTPSFIFSCLLSSSLRFISSSYPLIDGVVSCSSPSLRKFCYLLAFPANKRPY